MQKTKNNTFEVIRGRFERHWSVWGMDVLQHIDSWNTSNIS